MPKPNAPNLRHQAFAEHLAAGKSAKEAYLLAGYKVKDKTAEQEGSRLSRNPKVRAMIEAARLASTTSRVATAAEIKEFWSSVMKGEPQNNEIPRLADRIKAAELLAKTQALFVDRTQQEGKLEITVRRGADAAAALPPKE